MNKAVDLGISLFAHVFCYDDLVPHPVIHCVSSVEVKHYEVK